MKFKQFIQNLERIIYQAAIFVIGKIKLGARAAVSAYRSGGNKFLKYALIAIVIIYVALGVAFGVRLYAYGKTDKIDRIASNFYLFPIAQANRIILFDREYQYKVYWASNYAKKAQVEIPADLKSKILEDMVNSVVAIQQASANNIKVTGKDISFAIDQAISELGGEQKAKEFLKDYYGMKLSDLSTLMIPVIYQDKLKDSLFKQVKVRHILIKDEGKAKEVLQKIKDGGNFEDLAKQFSEDEGSKGDGGLLAGGEYLNRDSGIIPEFTDAMMSLKKGQVSDLVKTQFGYHIIKVEDVKGTVNQSFDDWIAGIVKKMKTRYLVKTS